MHLRYLSESSTSKDLHKRGSWRAEGFKDATTGNGIDKNERGVDRREKGTDAIR